MDDERVSIPASFPTGIMPWVGGTPFADGLYEYTEIPNPNYCGCGSCVHCNDKILSCGMEETVSIHVPIRWAVIKEIYNRILKRFGKPIPKKEPCVWSLASKKNTETSLFTVCAGWYISGCKKIEKLGHVGPVGRDWKLCPYCGGELKMEDENHG